ncbi:MAG: hypothetical protein ABSH41_28065 [Syntrophobacteraceae bacterium]|jgi:hypothetical protein
MSHLQAFAESVWIVDGPHVRDFGVMFTTRMTVVKLSKRFIMGEFACACAVRYAQTYH